MQKFKVTFVAEMDLEIERFQGDEHGTPSIEATCSNFCIESMVPMAKAANPADEPKGDDNAD